MKNGRINLCQYEGIGLADEDQRGLLQTQKKRDETRRGFVTRQTIERRSKDVQLEVVAFVPRFFGRIEVVPVSVVDRDSLVRCVSVVKVVVASTLLSEVVGVVHVRVIEKAVPVGRLAFAGGVELAWRPEGGDAQHDDHCNSDHGAAESGFAWHFAPCDVTRLSSFVSVLLWNGERVAQRRGSVSFIGSSQSPHQDFSSESSDSTTLPYGIPQTTRPSSFC